MRYPNIPRSFSSLYTLDGTVIIPKRSWALANQPWRQDFFFVCLLGVRL